MQFTDIDSPVQWGDFEATVTIEPDNDSGAPWENCDGHGPVSAWLTREKRPGELLLTNRHSNAKRFYDFAAACKIARRDGWGVAPYKTFAEKGAYGLIRLSGHWFDAANNLTDLHTDWHDCQNEARSQLYALHRATMSPRAYAALAAMQDYERLRDWCNDRWSYVGVVVTVQRDGETVARESLWGIESDAGDYLLTVANELLAEILPGLSSHRVMIAADLGVD
jgi:hypothetical protein